MRLTDVEVLKAQQRAHLRAGETPAQLGVVIFQGPVTQSIPRERGETVGSKPLLDEVGQSHL